MCTKRTKTKIFPESSEYRRKPTTSTELFDSCFQQQINTYTEWRNYNGKCKCHDGSSDTAVENTKSKHKWLAKGSRFAKKAILTATVMSSMAAMCTTQAFAATGEVDTSSFISTACTVLKSVICLIGAGVGVWGVVNLLEGYGNDNPGAKAQ